MPHPLSRILELRLNSILYNQTIGMGPMHLLPIINCQMHDHKLRIHSYCYITDFSEGSVQGSIPDAEWVSSQPQHPNSHLRTLIWVNFLPSLFKRQGSRKRPSAHLIFPHLPTLLLPAYQACLRAAVGWSLVYQPIPLLPRRLMLPTVSTIPKFQQGFALRH